MWVVCKVTLPFYKQNEDLTSTKYILHVAKMLVGIR